MQDATILKILNLHIRIQSKLNLELLICICFHCDEIAYFYLIGKFNSEFLVAFQFYVLGDELPRD